MFKVSQQINTFKLRNEIRKDLLPLRIDQNQKKYIFRFVSQNIGLLRVVLSLIFLVALFEVFIPVTINVFLKEFSYSFDVQALYTTFVFLVFLLAVYVFLNYYQIKFQKTLILIFINKLRRDWVKNFFKKSAFNQNKEEKGKLLVKISYHFSLLQLGLSNTFFASFQYLFILSGLVITSFFISTPVLIISLLFVPFSLLIILIGYLVSSFYVAQDQTFYSKILLSVSNATDDFAYIKMTNSDKSFLQNLDNLVNIDSYFRVKREIVMDIGNKIIFTLLALFSGIIYLVHVNYSIFDFEGIAKTLVYIIIFGLMIKILYLSLRIGIYYFPLKLGLFLSIPNFNLKGNLKIVIGKNITFQTKKTKLSENYYKNLKIEVCGNDRVLVISNEKNNGTLAGIFSGQVSQAIGRSWVIKIDKRRFLYKDWFINSKDTFYINPVFSVNMSVYDFLFGNNIGSIEEKIANNKFFENEIFDFVFKKSNQLKINLKRGELSLVDTFLIQILFCLVHKPKLIIVDSLWFDLSNDRVLRAIQLLDNVLVESKILCFAGGENSIIKYDKTYKI